VLSFFIFAALAYGGASFAFGAAADPSKPRWPRILLAAAALLHTATIGAQCVDGFHPLQNVYLAMSGGALLAVLGFLGLSAVRRPMRALGAVLAPAGLIGLTVGVVMGPGQSGDATPIPGMLKAHIASATLGVAGFALAAGVAGLYLAKERRLRSKNFRPGQGGMSLTGLERLHYWLVLAMTPIFTLAIVTGALHMIGEGHDAWRDRPIEVGVSLVAWLASVIALGSRAIWGVRGRRAALLTFLAFAAMLIVVITYGVRS
jgi:ABC-type uncharacterized transport system permease subunit